MFTNTSQLIKSYIRTIPNYPKNGIMYRDITTLLIDPEGFQKVINELTKRYSSMKIVKIAAIESRGFIIGAALAYKLGLGFVPIRKKGRLPADTIGCDYSLEYGLDRIEIHSDAIKNGEPILLVDDLIATGGTAEAAVKLIEQLGGVIVECCFVINLPDLNGKLRLEKIGKKIYTLCEFRGE